MQDIARDRAAGIGKHAKQRGRRIAEPPIDLLEGEHADRAERPNNVCGKRRGSADADLQMNNGSTISAVAATASVTS
jgi:hypothetical protein